VRVLKLNRGFTLVELLVVIGVLSIVITGITMVIDPISQLQKSRDSKRKSELSQLQKTLEAFANDTGKFPASSSTTPCPDSKSVTRTYSLYPNNVCVGWGSQWTAYNTRAPIDPNSTTVAGSSTYAYWASSDGQSYAIYASLERGEKDPQACNPDNNTSTNDACSNAINVGVNGCGTGKICNFGVSSSNISP
jgi:prepilin-type N-terminal cleavage/methylation domain-containing protein